MDEVKITWNDVKENPKPQRKGLYLIAYGAKNVAVGLYEKSEWSLYGKESENGGYIKVTPYAWAKLPDAP